MIARWLIAAAPVAMALALAAGTGCKGKVEYKDSPETLDNLQKCQGQVTDKDAYIEKLNAELAKLRAGGSAGELVITAEGEVVVKGSSSSGGSSSKPPADVSKQAAAFKKHVGNSYGAIRRCYNNALKKDSSLDAKTISLELSVRYKPTGKVSSVGLSKRISSAFAGCIESVVASWTVPETSGPVTFRQPYSLTPQ